MAKGNEIRGVIKLKSSVDTGFFYYTRKNRRNTPDRLRVMKFDPVVRHKVEFVETR
ncbi:MAG: 50S ribosomal protein L33 [Bifidobacteriaceae bacterium]|jgi:large subunit ribosomal protein L33|nr:50S ribosomal protein L33 [Bifidobacteriaceae bacterium]MCI1914903.1 50S ribosomal protein L33 [Bifidobacteriaceae bacterium]